MRPPPHREEPDEAGGGEESEEVMESEAGEPEELEAEGEEEEEEIEMQEEQEGGGSDVAPSQGGDAEAEEQIGDRPLEIQSPPRVMADVPQPDMACSADEQPSLSSPDGSDAPPDEGLQDKVSSRRRRHTEFGDMVGHRKKRRRHSRREDRAEGGMPDNLPNGQVGPLVELPTQDTSAKQPEEEETEDRLRPETIAILRQLVTEIYSESNPTKLAEVDVLFAKYAGMEFAMYERICDKYGKRAETLATIKMRHQAAREPARPPRSSKGTQREKPAAPPHDAGGFDTHSGWPFAGEPFSPNSDMSDGSFLMDQYAGLAADPWKPPGNNAFMPPPPGVHHPYGPPPGMPPYWGWPGAGGPPPGYPNGCGIYGGPAARAVEKIDLPHLLGEWRDSSGHDVKVEWASSSSSKTGALLDVQLRRRGKSDEPTRLHVKRVDGRLQCGHYDLDLGKSAFHRIVWSDFNTSGKESIWERGQ